MNEGATRTTCPYCGVGCGVLARPLPDGSVEIAGDDEHPANRGRLCSKGTALGETLSHDGRLLHPEIDGRPATWDEALDLVARRFAETVRQHGPEAVAFYVSGQMLTEDYYVANKLMKGFIGAANIDTNSRLCMASSVAGHKRAFGSDTVPGCYEDLETADLVVLVGSNLAWCHPVLYQRLAAARERRGTKVVVIDPRATATAEIADLHLAIAPGTDVALFNGLLAHLAAMGRIDRPFVESKTSGFADALALASEMDFAGIVAVTELPAQAIADFYELFADTERVVTVYSQGVNQSSAGTDKVNAIINCHLATGRIGRPGMGPFSVTGQPNAMGGREVGGLATMLAAHMELANADHRRIVQHFWASPGIAAKPGLKAVDLFRAVGDGRIKALWIMATNPVVSLPEADRVRAAIEGCPFVVVSDVVRDTDTTALAHVLLPAAAWGEKDGTVTNSERRISRQRAFLAPPGSARPDWWQISEVARRMGFGEAFAYASPRDIFAEHAALSGTENDGQRAFDISAHARIDAAAYDRLAPFQWPQPAGATAKETRFFASGEFYTPDRRGQLVALRYRPPATTTDPLFPLVLNTGRIRDQWHTMTRTAKAPRLMAQAPEPFIELNPDDATALDLTDGTIAELRSTHGRGLFRVVVSEGQRRGSVFAPMHWTGQWASCARIDALVDAATDPISGQPELKHTPVSVRAFESAWHGALLSLARPRMDLAEYVAIAVQKRGFAAELAGSAAPDDWDRYARSALGIEGGEDTELLSYRDAKAGQHRFAAFRGESLIGLLFVGASPVRIARTWAAEQLGEALALPGRLRLLAGRPGGPARDRGPIVCACLEVGRNDIAEAVIRDGCGSVEAVGARTKAGTNCGSCRAEIGRILHALRLQEAS